MSIYLLGEAKGGPPFDKGFFTRGLREVASGLGGEGRHRLTLYLADGTRMDVCEFIQISDAFVALRASVEDSPECELAVSVIPYGLIYRVEVGPLGINEKRIGFQWSMAAAGERSVSGPAGAAKDAPVQGAGRRRAGGTKA